MSTKSIPIWVTLLFLIAAGGAVYGIMKSKETTQPAPDFAEQAPSTDVTFIDFLLPERWPFKERAEEDTEVLGKGQYVQRGVVQDPVRDETVYFATAAFTAATEENALSIYRYNELTYEFERLYRGTYEQGESSYLAKDAWPVWNVIGYDRNGLVVLLIDGDAAVDPCDDPLLLGNAENKIATLLRLDLADPSAGLTPWEPSDDLLDEAEERQETCQTK